MAQQQPTEPGASVKVFFCYSRANSEDRQARRNIEKHLSALKHAGKITILHRRTFLAGDKVQEDYSHLYAADIIFLLISADYISSEQHWGTEVPLALEQRKQRKAQVIPIILRPVLWKDTIIGDLKSLPAQNRPISQWPDRDLVLEDMAKEISQIVESILKRIKEERERQAQKQMLEKLLADLQEEIKKESAHLDMLVDILESTRISQTQLEEELLAVKNKRDQLERDIIHQKIVQKQREEKAENLNTLLLIL